MLNGPIIHHTALSRSGGATRIALLLLEELSRNGIETAHSFEASENPGDRLISPREAAGSIPENSIVHLHSSADPAEFLNALPESAKIFITMHDAQMITGGCAYPLDCPHFKKNCLDPCPRNYQSSEEVRARNISALLGSGANLISPSRWMAGLIQQSHKDLTVKIIPNGIPWPDDPGDRKKARESIGLHHSARMVLFVAHGGLKAGYKSGPTWPEYWRIIKNSVPDAVAFAIGGDSSSRNGNFIILPYVDRRTLSNFMVAADVLAYPTLADNHPLIILEAMSNSLVPVSYNVGGVAEQIINNENGILVTPYEKEEFADTVSYMLHHRALSRKMGAAGFYKGRMKFSSSRMCADYRKIYGIEI